MEGVDTAGDNLDEKGLDLEEEVDCKAEEKASSSDAEGRTSKIEVVHTGVECKGCEVRTSVITDYSRRYL